MGPGGIQNDENVCSVGTAQDQSDENVCSAGTAWDQNDKNVCGASSHQDEDTSKNKKQMTYQEALLGLDRTQTFRFTQFVKHFASTFVVFR